MIVLLKIFESLKSLWPFIQRHYKTIVFTVVTLLMLYFWWRSGHERHRAEDAEQGRDAAIRISNGLSSEVHKYVNKLGDTVMQIRSTTIPKSQLPEILKEEKAKWIDEKFPGVKKDGSNLVSAESFETSFLAEVIKSDTVSLPCKDSLKAEKYHYKDSWNDIEATVIGKPKFDLRDHYYGVVYLKRPKGWFWKFQWSKRETVAEITNSNKLIKIDSLMEIEIKR